MSEYIIEIPDEYFAGYDTKRDMYYPDERDSAMRITPLVRCRDCKHHVNGVCAREDDEIGWLLFKVEPASFCSWGIKKSEVVDHVAD